MPHKTREAARTYEKKYYSDPVNRERKRKRAQVWHKQRSRGRGERYGMPAGWYENKVLEQCGKCAACEDTGPLEIDHCHATGRVRDLLCGPCNRALGSAKEDPNRLRAVADYAARWSSDA